MVGTGCRRLERSTTAATFVALSVALILTTGPAQTADGAATPSTEKQLASQKTGREPTGAALAPESSEQRHIAEVRGAHVLPTYRPPRRGSPRARVGGGLRGARALPTPLALAPDHVGQTISAQPSLFWHIDGPPGGGKQLVFTLIDEEGIDPLVEVTLATPQRSGIWRIRLADYAAHLAPGAEYQWSVALIPDPAHRAKDIVSSGYIRRVAAPEQLGLRKSSVETYADLGLWYDALESISDSIDAAPADRVLRAQRNALLRRAKLDAAIE